MYWSGFLRTLNTSLSYGKCGGEGLGSQKRSWMKVIPSETCVSPPQPRGNQGFKSGLGCALCFGGARAAVARCEKLLSWGYYTAGEYQELESIVYFFCECRTY